MLSLIASSLNLYGSAVLSVYVSLWCVCVFVYLCVRVCVCVCVCVCVSLLSLPCCENGLSTASVYVLCSLGESSQGFFNCFSRQWSAAEIARQMTLIEFAYFSTLQPREFFNLAWTRRVSTAPFLVSDIHLSSIVCDHPWLVTPMQNKHSQAPNIMRCTDHFNRMAQFVATTIVNEPNLRKRAAIFTKWIDVADVCLSPPHS